MRARPRADLLSRGAGPQSRRGRRAARATRGVLRFRALSAAVLLALVAPAAWAQTGAGPAFLIHELFSNADGTVQFVELCEPDGRGGQDAFAGEVLRFESPLLSFPFPNDLPSSDTRFRFVLVGTASVASAFGVSPDFTLAPGSFDPSTLSLVAFSDTDQFFVQAGELPTDGVRSLNRFVPGLPSARDATPANFAGEGTVTACPEPAAAELALASGAALALLARARQLRRAG